MFQGLHHVQLAMPRGEEADEVVRRLGEAGQQVTWDGDFPGFRRICAHDPFGNRLEFLESVASF